MPMRQGPAHATGAPFDMHHNFTPQRLLHKAGLTAHLVGAACTSWISAHGALAHTPHHVM